MGLLLAVPQEHSHEAMKKPESVRLTVTSALLLPMVINSLEMYSAVSRIISLSGHNREIEGYKEGRRHRGGGQVRRRSQGQHLPIALESAK
jgi:hypothetical protein